MHSPIPFNKPFIAGKELFYVAQAATFGQIARDGHFTRAYRKPQYVGRLVLPAEAPHGPKP